MHTRLDHQQKNHDISMMSGGPAPAHNFFNTHTQLTSRAVRARCMCKCSRNSTRKNDTDTRSPEMSCRWASSDPPSDSPPEATVCAARPARACHMLEQRCCLCHRPSRRRRHERHHRPAAAQPPPEPPPELPLAAVRPAAAAHQPPLSRRPSRRLSCRWPPSDPRRPTRRMPRPPRSGARACHRHDVHWCTAAGPVVHDPRAFSPRMLRAHGADMMGVRTASRCDAHGCTAQRSRRPPWQPRSLPFSAPRSPPCPLPAALPAALPARNCTSR